MFKMQRQPNPVIKKKKKKKEEAKTTFSLLISFRYQHLAALPLVFNFMIKELQMEVNILN
jgi:hypothetical protein